MQLLDRPRHGEQEVDRFSARVNAAATGGVGRFRIYFCARHASTSVAASRARSYHHGITPRARARYRSSREEATARARRARQHRRRCDAAADFSRLLMRSWRRAVITVAGDIHSTGVARRATLYSAYFSRTARHRRAPRTFIIMLDDDRQELATPRSQSASRRFLRLSVGARLEMPRCMRARHLPRFAGLLRPLARAHRRSFGRRAAVLRFNGDIAAMMSRAIECVGAPPRPFTRSSASKWATPRARWAPPSRL